MTGTHDPDARTTEPKRTIEIPERTAEALARRRTGTEFESLDEYAAFALAELVRHLERLDTGESEPPADGPDGESVEERLESLGYL